MLLHTSRKSSSWEAHWQNVRAVDSIWRLLFLLPHSPPVNRPSWRGSDSCVHAGELLKFPVCPLREPPQFWLLELWVKMPCFPTYPHWLSRSLYLSSNFCFMSTWGLISIPHPRRFYLAIQVPVLFLRTSQALPHYPLRFLMEPLGLVWNITSSGRCLTRVGSTGKERDTEVCCCLTLSRTYWNTACAGAKVKEGSPHLSAGIWVCPVSQSNGNVEALRLTVSISLYMKDVRLL